MIDSHDIQQMFKDYLYASRRFLLVFQDTKLAVYFASDRTFTIKDLHNNLFISPNSSELSRTDPNCKSFFDFFDKLMIIQSAKKYPCSTRAIWFDFTHCISEIVKLELPNDVCIKSYPYD